MDVSNQAADRIHDILSAFIMNSEKVSRDQDLRELGLTSMQMVSLMLSIEAEFDLTIPPSKLLPINFRTIESIKNLLSELAH